MSDLVTYRVEDGLARIELNRPQASNAVDLPTALALDDAVGRAGADDAVRAVLLSGAGKRFCAGGDVSSMLALDGEEQATYLLELAGALDGALQRLAALELPTVAAVQGAVAGAGLAVMLSCDVTVAARSTKFVMAYSGVGLTPDCGVSSLLPRAIGQPRALAMALTDRAVTADEALDWGLVAEVAEDESAGDRALEVARALAGGPSYALGQAKRLLRSAWETSRDEMGAEEARTIAAAVRTTDAQQALARFARR